MVKLMILFVAGVLVTLVAPPTHAESPRDEIDAALIAFATAFNRGDGGAATR